MAWKTVYTLRCRSRHNWYNLSHYPFCQSAQYLRSSGSYMWRNLRAIKIDRENLRFWWVNQLFLAKSKQKLLCTTKIPWMTKLFGSSTFNKLNRFHQKTKWVNSVRKQDLCVLLKLDNISWQETLVILDNFKQWLVANTPFHETTKLLNQKDGFKEIWKLDLYWKSRPVFSTSNMELKFELGPWIKTILILGSEFPMEQSNMWSILLKTTQKILLIHKKSEFHKQAPGGCSQVKGKSNATTESTRWYNSNHTNTWKKMDWHWTIKKILLRTTSRRKWSIFFDTIKRYSEKKMEQLNSAKSNSIFEIIVHKYSIGLMIVGKLVWLQYCSDNSGTILYLRALQGRSGSNLIDPMLQDNVVIGTGIFHFFYHVGCAFNLHSIINNGLIPGGQDLSRRQTVFFLPVDPRDTDHKDPEHIDFSVPRRARYVHSAWKRHQDAVFWVDIDLAIREGLTFYQTRSNAIILQGTLPAHCISRVERLKTGEMLYERRYLSPRPPPKISLKHDHNWTKGNDQSGSTVEQQPVGESSFNILLEKHLVLNFPSQPNPDPIQSVIDRGNLRTQIMFFCWLR